MFYASFWVIPQGLNFICRRFGTLFHLHRQVGMKYVSYTYLPMKMEQTECSETSAYKIQTPGTYPEESIQQSSPNLTVSLRGTLSVDLVRTRVLIFYNKLTRCSENKIISEHKTTELHLLNGHLFF
jgi:hypothetical protein